MQKGVKKVFILCFLHDFFNFSKLKEESDEEKTIVTKKSPEVINKRAVSFVSASKLVSAKSVTIDPVDSLEVSRKTSNSSEDDDEKYTDNVVLSNYTKKIPF